jgi:hypothetical protein
LLALVAEACGKQAAVALVVIELLLELLVAVQVLNLPLH